MAFVPSQVGQFIDFRATAGVNPGLDVIYDFNQFSTAQTVRIFGAFDIATAATGVVKGTAGAGTTTSQINKPTGAANWTAGQLEDRGVYVRIVGGGGAPTDGSEVLCEILSNTTTAIFINPTTGVDSTTRFQLVTLATLVDQISSSVKIAIRALACNVPLEIYGLDFTNVNNLDSLIKVSDGSSVYLQGCNIDYNTSDPAVYVLRCNNVEMSNCYQTNSGDVMISQCNNAEVTGFYANGGGAVLMQDCLVAKLLLHVSEAAPSRVAGFIRCNYGQAEITANNGTTATPVYVESCNTFDAVGTLIVGTGNLGASAYGIEVARAGNLSLVGCTITGAAGDLLFQSDAISWATLSSPGYGVIQKYAGSAVATVGQSKAIVNGNYAFQGDLNLGGRFLTFGYCNLAANATVITLTGTQSINMGNGSIDGAPATTEAPRGCLDVICNSATAQAVLPDGEAIAGGYGWILNHGSQPLPLVAPSGGTIVGATSAPINKIVFFANINLNSGKTFFVSVLP